MPTKIYDLIVRYRTGGARKNVRLLDLGVLVEIREDGVGRKPKTEHVDTAFRWLANADFEPTAHVWLDGHQARVRRQKITFERVTDHEGRDVN